MSKIDEFLEEMKYIEKNSDDLYVNDLMNLARAVESDMQELSERETQAFKDGYKTGVANSAKIKILAETKPMPEEPKNSVDAFMFDDELDLILTEFFNMRIRLEGGTTPHSSITRSELVAAIKEKYTANSEIVKAIGNIDTYWTAKEYEGLTFGEALLEALGLD